MCLGPEIMLAMAMSGAGSYLENQEAMRNAEAMAEAQNAELAKHNAKQDALALQNRNRLDAQLGDMGGTEAQEAIAAEKTDALTDRINNDIGVSQMAPGNAPKVAQTDFAKQIGEAIASNKQKAGALAQLGSFGDQFKTHNLGIDDVNRNFGVTGNFAQGNAAMLPHMQQFAGLEAQKAPGLAPQLLKIGGAALGATAPGSGGPGLGSLFQKKTKIPGGPGLGVLF